MKNIICKLKDCLRSVTHDSIKSIFSTSIHNQAQYVRTDLLLICFSFSIADLNALTYSVVLNVYLTYNSDWIKLQPAIFPLSQRVNRFHELLADSTQRFLQ